MLFNSYVFILVFLPVALVLFHGLRRMRSDRGAMLVLAAMSLLFYGWWSLKYLALLITLLLVNYVLVNSIAIFRNRNHSVHAKAALLVGLSFNLAALGYYKYANFFVDNLNALFATDFVLATIILPLGISFFTFQKIALLVDVYQGKTGRLDLLDYSLFVVFFPQLIAGPIVHHSEMMPQFRQPARMQASLLALGTTVFVIGLAKKVLLADTAAAYATPPFDAAAAGSRLDMLSAWGGALAYTAQLYFDFSAYSDMAIGIGLMFGIRLPINFASPYKAANIIDFWRRWHMTLSRFLRDYIYIPLGGSRKGGAWRYVNLFLTMLIGGIWHGAGWTFVAWGALHGAYLAVNHGWRELRVRIGMRAESSSRCGIWLARAITFLAVVVAWVFFRAADIDTALAILGAMAGNNGIAASTPQSDFSALTLAAPPGDSSIAFAVASLLLLLAWIAPNTQQMTGYTGPEVTYGFPIADPASATLRWSGSWRWALAIGALCAMSMTLMSRVSEFIYFQF